MGNFAIGILLFLEPTTLAPQSSRQLNQPSMICMEWHHSLEFQMGMMDSSLGSHGRKLWANM